MGLPIKLPSWLEVRRLGGSLVWQASFCVVYFPSEAAPEAAETSAPEALLTLMRGGGPRPKSCDAEALVGLVESCTHCGGSGEFECTHCGGSGSLSCRVEGCSLHGCAVCEGDGLELCPCDVWSVDATTEIEGIEVRTRFLYPLRAVLAGGGAATWDVVETAKTPALVVRHESGAALLLACMTARKPGEERRVRKAAL